MILKIFYIGKDRVFVEFDKTGNTSGFHIVDNKTNMKKLISKKIYESIKKETGKIYYHGKTYNNYFKSRSPVQMIQI